MPRRKDVISDRDLLVKLSMGLSIDELRRELETSYSLLSNRLRRLKVKAGYKTTEQLMYEFALLTDGDLEIEGIFDPEGAWIWHKTLERLRIRYQRRLG